ncbi:hypothetical protein [Rhizobium lentis]|uniref:Uncharacterized protein n=1 Tax=Rhizobium lentis TaxID=1138194 RepID=A0A7W8XL13_9HYPH|nr:hypothetical protein [Rhizobium lentis]MBB4577524.1 hypothetical protein [Rhizobium lentis]MBB5553221.1 hypothetical protein [Rhizobium lentis]MBB5564730.1 hypothetical protein [Rhizobium lentis]MBB5571316.1 hypothetical protein [Rhizobium lentis]
MRDLIVFLLSDSTSTSEECRLVAAGDQPVQFDQRRKIDTCKTHGHDAAHHRINHPARNRDHDTCRPQNLQKPTRRSFFDATNGNPLAKIRMPAIRDLDFIADMGRMNGALESEEKTLMTIIKV